MTQPEHDTNSGPVPLEPIGTVSFNYHELRSLAEYASSIRGKDAYFVRGEDGWEVHTDPGELSGRQAIRVYNRPLPDRPQVFSGHLRARRGEHGPVTEANLMALPDPHNPGKTVEADAVFWTESAVEKFLVPYYASVFGDQADVEIEKLLNVLDSPRERPGGAGPAPANAGDAFALAHIPRSEYVTVTGGASVVVLAYGPGGLETFALDPHAARQAPNNGLNSGSRST